MIAIADPGRPDDRRRADRRARRMRLSRAPLAEIAEKLGASLERVEAVLERLQALEPTGVFARSLAECLKLQLIERDRYDPAMQAMIEQSAGARQARFATLRRVCGVDDADIVDMIAEIRRLDPKPGRDFGGAVEPSASPTCSSPPRPTIPGASNSTRRAAAGARQRDLRRPCQRGKTRDADKVYVRQSADRQLADQEPRAARPHHSQRGQRDRAPPGRLSGRGRRRPEAAQSEGGRRRDRRARIRRCRAPPPTSSSRRRAACSR